MFSRKDCVNHTTLTQLINKLGYLLFENDLVIDSRKVHPKSIFCAYPGLNHDGRQFIESAIKEKVKAVVYESQGYAFNYNILNYPVENLMNYVGLLASIKYNKPSEKYKTIGVTGTNGKTSITNWINQVYTNLGKKSAIVGTLGAGLYPEIKDLGYTTPDPITLQEVLYDFALDEADVLAMEVSSHALIQGRVNGVIFNTAIFTNLTQDHLDYHKTMEAYYLAKERLFYWQGLKCAIINSDDKYGKRLADELNINNANQPLKIITYGINTGDLLAQNIKITLDGMQFKLKYQDNEANAQVKIIGKFNVYNLLAVSACLLSEGYPLEQISEFLAKLKPVCGRMDTLKYHDKPLIVIDYAHTPDALSNTLTTLKEVEHRGKIYCVFGCGGNRDATKRPLMGDIASDLADFAYITTDNPRYENPESIIEQIADGINSNNYKIVVNRENAIRQAIMRANSNDIVLIAGKGHETYQEIEGVRHHFSDFEVAKEVLASK